MKFGQLIEYNTGNIFLQKSCRKWTIFCFLFFIFLVHNKNKLWINFELIQRCAQFWFFSKGSGNRISTTFCVWFFKKNVFYVIFFWRNKFNCLIVFTSRDIGQLVYCNCLLPRLWRHEFWNQPYLSY